MNHDPVKAPCQVVIIGAGFAGLNAAKGLGAKPGVDVTVIDRRNHHLFQPLLYQVAMAGLSPADIAVPIRSILRGFKNIRVMKADATGLDLQARSVTTDHGAVPYDVLVLACGARHDYFGNDAWEPNAPGLKTLAQATEIRRRVLSALEEAEVANDAEEQKRLLTFVVVGAGPTGVELAGAIGEMTRFTLARDFRSIDPSHTRILLVEGGERVLRTFHPTLSSKAARVLESLGVQIWTKSMVTQIDDDGIALGEERVRAATVIWAAGVRSAELGGKSGGELDRAGRVKVGSDCALPGHPNVFVLGDMALVTDKTGAPLPGVAPVAMQQGHYAARTILQDLRGTPREPFAYKNKGQMATIGKSKAIVELGRLRMAGTLAWFVWLLVHIYYLTGFRNRLIVVIQWSFSYLTYRRGARLIVNRDWRNSNRT
jgi:NADH dehydrogenase